MDIPTKHALSLFFFFFLAIRSGRIFSAEAENTVVPVNVGVVLDLDTWNGKMGLSCINMALSDFYSSRSYYKTRLVLNAKDSKRDVVSAASAALQLIKDAEVQAIIGPQNSMQADFVIQLGEKAQVPIISFSATNPSLTSLRSPYFFRAAQNDSSQVKAISAIIQAFGWRQIVPIYVDNEFGKGIISFLVDALQEIDARVPYRSAIAPSATDDEIGQKLYKLMTMQTRVFVVHMEPKLGSRLFTKAKEIGMMSEGYVWIITNAMANSLNAIEPSVLESMHGVLGVKTYTPNTKELQNFTVKWKRKFQQENPSIIDADLNVLGLWAYDAASALARAVEKVGTTSFGFENTNASSNLTHVLETTGKSRNGPKLRQVLLGTRFRGLAGEFNLVNGQLESSTFKIINVNGNGERAVAFWSTPGRGLSKKLNASNTPANSTSKDNIGTIIWPGDTSSLPKGWEIPTNGKKLRIGVPGNGGFKEFVNVEYDISTGTKQVTGYCIDVFKAVVETLPYAVRYEFIPFDLMPDGPSSATYDDLVYQVFLGKFDAVVGDVTILANRSNFVDFTLPFTESGVSMVVPITDNGKKNAWVFLKPLTWDLWLTSGCSFVFIGFVVWILEHRINEDFRGNHANQIGTSLWFSFSTMGLGHREKVVSNCTRFVVIIWIFVVLILTQSYTASLASFLTVQQLQPTVTDVDQLIKNGENVGYPKGSFILETLPRMKFKESQLKQYYTTEECDELLSNGTANGGIAAAFDETPYMKLFLAKYCSKYTTVQLVYRTDGFGFVFPKGSPLVSDFSRGILNVTEGEKMKEIESAWFGKETDNCSTSNSQLSSHSLSLESFLGLFLIAGVASLAALIFSLSMFLYKERERIFAPSVAEVSIGGKIQHILTVFDSLDSLHPAGEKLQKEKNNKVHDGAIEVSRHKSSPTSRSSHSTQLDSNSSVVRGLETPSTENGDSSSNGQTSQPALNIELIGQPNPERSQTTEIDDENS